MGSSGSYKGWDHPARQPTPEGVRFYLENREPFKMYLELEGARGSNWEEDVPWYLNEYTRIRGVRLCKRDASYFIRSFIPWWYYND